MKTANQFPKRTTSPVARSLHARLRYLPGYKTDNRLSWVLKSVLRLSGSDLPIGCKDAALVLKAVKLPTKLTRILSIDQACKIIVEVGRYRAYQHAEEEAFELEQARKR